MNRRMVQEAIDTLDGADVVVLVVDASVRQGSGDQYLLDLVLRSKSPRIVVLNKIDLMSKPKLLPIMERYAKSGLDPIIPISALEGDGTELLLSELFERMPEGQPHYAQDLLSPHSERFLVAERIREKLLDQTRDELPFASAVLIERWEEDPSSGRLHVSATILVEKPGQKRIVIGQGGSKIKAIGIAARQDLQAYLDRSVHLELFVREEPGWRENPRVLSELDRMVLAYDS
jgi:GTP-binding protein Era